MGTYANSFPKSQCTWGAASMKGNVTWRGNANRWDDNARAQGKVVSATPIIGAIAQSDRGRAGHVAVVVDTSPGRVLITEKNYNYRGGVRTVWQDVGRYKYIWM